MNNNQNNITGDLILDMVEALRSLVTKFDHWKQSMYRFAKSSQNPHGLGILTNKITNYVR